MTIRFAALGAVAAFMLAVPVQAATLIVTNGSFESGPVGGMIEANKGLVNKAYFDNLGKNGKPNWDVWASLPGWTSTGTGIEIQSKPTLGLTPLGFTPSGLTTEEGKRYVELDSHPNSVRTSTNSSMSQDVLLKRGEYLLSFYFSPRAKGSDSADKLAKSNVIEYSVGSLVTGSVTGPSTKFGTAVGQWTRITASFIADKAGSYALTFSAKGDENTYGGLIDNVAIDYVAPVPVPAAGLLLLGGLGGLAALKRRRKA
jgi:hypothetical protein